MKIAYTMAPGRGDIDFLLNRLASKLTTEGIRCCGTVQTNTENADGPCDMDVKVLPLGPTFRISQSLGPASTGCRLDPSALEQAVGLTQTALSQGADILIINKFGKHEAEGRGFRTAIADAIGQDIPVLIGVNALNLHAFQEFAGEDIKKVDPVMPDILNWCLGAVGKMTNAA